MEAIWAWLHTPARFTEDVPGCQDFRAEVINRPHVVQVQFFTPSGDEGAVDDAGYYSSRDHHLGLLKFYPGWAVLTVDSERLESQWLRVRRTFYKIETLERLHAILNGTDWGGTDAPMDPEVGEVDRMVWGEGW